MYSRSFLKLFYLILLLKYRSCEKGSTWAVLHAGWVEYYVSYGMEAAVYRMYHLLIKNGIPKNQIITISSDAAAYHPENPLPGVVVHAANGNPFNSRNLYEDVVIDYEPKDLDLDLFFEIMNGNEVAVKNITGSGKVLKTGPNDHVLFFTSSFGTYGALLFGPNTEFYADTFIPRLEKLKDKKRFAKMLMFVDADSPGSMFDDYLDTSKNILVYTVGGRHTSMYMTELNNLIKAHTGTLSSSIFLNTLQWLMESRNESLTVFDHYILARNAALTDLDPLNLYGSLNLGEEKLHNFFGKSINENLNTRTIEEDAMKSISFTLNDIVKIDKAFENSGAVPRTEIVTLQNKLTAIYSKLLTIIGYSVNDLETMRPNLPLKKYECYKSAVETVKASCFNEKNYAILLTHAKNFAKLCSFGIEYRQIAQVTREVCVREIVY